MRIFIVSGHPVTQLGWAAMLHSAGGFATVGTASRGGAAIVAIAAAVSGIDLVLVDLDLPDMPGTHLVRTLLPLHPPLRFALLAEHNAPSLPHDTQPLASRIGQVHRDASVLELALALRRLHLEDEPSGPEFGSPARPNLDSGSRNGAASAGPERRLTQRERELLALMGLGLSNQQISERLHIAMPTVKFHVTHILSKMGADNRTEAVLMGLRNGLVRLQ